MNAPGLSVGTIGTLASRAAPTGLVPFAALAVVLTVASALGCGGRAPAEVARDAGGSAASDAAISPAASGSIVDGGNDANASEDAREDAGQGVCTLSVSGAFQAQGAGVPSGGIELPGVLSFHCNVGPADAPLAAFGLYVDTITGPIGPGTYAARGSYSALACNEPNGCGWGVDDWGYWNVGPGGNGAWNSPLCTLNVQALSPARRAGMRATFDCSIIEPTWYDGPSAPPPIAVSGTLDLPPAAASAASSDAGAGDSGAPTDLGRCSLVAGGEYPAEGAKGTGEEVGSTVLCDVEAGGVSYAISIDETLAPGVSLQGSTWCAAGCWIDYAGGASGVADGSRCSLDVVEDQGIGGAFVANFTCDRLTAADGTSLRLQGSIDGRHLPEPLPQ